MEEKLFYRREVNKSVLWDGFGIDREYLEQFLAGIGELKRGEKSDITLLFNDVAYGVEIKNLNNPQERRLNDAYQLRYPANGEFAKVLQAVFHNTYKYICEQRIIEEQNGKKKRIRVNVPVELKEYIDFYTTEDPRVFTCKPVILSKCV